MRAISCPLCERDDTHPVSRRRDRGLVLTTVACRGCGLVYHNPVIEDEDRRHLEISPRQWHTDTTGNLRQHRKLEQRWSRQWPLVQRVFQPHFRVLEIGCGLGVASGRLHRLGARVWAVEPDPEQAAYAERRWGLSIFQGRFEELNWSGEPFDLIFSSHVIEHFADPLAALVQARAYAHRDAWLFLETPNILAPKVSFRRLFSPAHNFYFSPQTLSWLLLKAGWRVAHLQVWRRDSFQVLARFALPENPVVDPQAAPEVLLALARHRYQYYLKSLFLWRKIPWYQKYWMYTPDPQYKEVLGGGG
jgi:2-polyprenyl-3-methyl-5-hydroxy-6-metoxy-1,4-benzoquinol methylase